MRTARPWTRLSLLLLLGCTHASGEKVAPPASQVRSPLREASIGPAASARDKPGPRPAQARTGRARTHYDLAAHPERAELRKGEALIIDFGERGDAKYTFGGWLSGSGRSQQLDGASMLVVPDKIIKLALPSEHEGAAELGLCVRGFAPGPLTVYVNGETVADLKLSGSVPERFTLPIAPSVLRRGENSLQLRVTRAGSAPGVAKAGLAIDWIWLAPAGAGLADAQVVGTGAVRAQVDTQTGRAQLRVPAGHRLGFALEMPARAELRAVARSAGSAPLSVWAIRDAHPPRALGDVVA
jgi:choline-sulfatase